MNATSKRKPGQPVRYKGPITNFRLEPLAMDSLTIITRRTGWTKTRAVEQALRFAAASPGFHFQSDDN
jgi:NAD(P)H-flavin reductase